MSLEAVQRIIGRAVTDSDFREALKTQPDSVLADRDVTPEETQALKGMDWESVSSVLGSIEDSEVTPRKRAGRVLQHLSPSRKRWTRQASSARRRTTRSVGQMSHKANMAVASKAERESTGPEPRQSSERGLLTGGTGSTEGQP
jgi:hypothetical protein